MNGHQIRGAASPGFGESVPARWSSSKSKAEGHPKGPFRITRSVFDDVSIWMASVGLIIGAIFPPMLVAFGVPREIVFTRFFILVCLLAGILVGVVNIWLMRIVFKPRLRSLVDGMHLIESVIEEATYTGDWSRCDPESCRLPVDSDDLIGESADAFNRLIHVLQNSHQIEDRVAEFSKSMTSQLELKPLCNGALSGFMAATSATAGAVLADVGGELSVLASFGIAETGSLCENDHVRLAFQTHKPTYVELPEELSVHAGIVEFQPREVAFIPLGVGTTATAVVVLARATVFERDSRPLSQIFARTFAMALSNAMAHDDLQRVAALDPLTNCYNRRFGLARLREEFTRATRSDSPLGIVLFDIDHFKAVNDSYGHLVGDRILANVTKEAGKQLREGDVVVRYGGEEFLCILPGASIEGTAEVCERIRRAIESLVVRDRGRDICCTVSLGCACFPMPDVGDETELIRAADDALYRAKQGGRNRTVKARQSDCIR